MGGKSTSTTAVRLNAISVSTSALGVVIPKVWGTTRLKTNMIWYGAFKSQSHSSSQGGKGGSSTSNTTYTYSAAMALGLCSGPITGVSKVYVNKSVYTNGGTTALAQAGLSLATGAIGQSVWSWLSTNAPTQAIGYSGLAYLYASSYALDSSGNPPNISVEVTSTTAFSANGDAKPDVVLNDFLTNGTDGVPGWPAGALGSLTNYGTYCLAANLLLSPVLDQQVKASQFIDDLMASTNSMCLWSEGLLKVVPLGTLAVTGNSTTFTPSLSPAYTLTDSAFIPPGPGEPPLSFDISDQSDAYNIVQVEFLDRANQYNTAIASRQDDANISLYGPRKQDPKTLHMICDATIAANVAQIILQQTLYVRGEYHFSVPWSYALLEPGDLVGITDSLLGLSNFLVRIKQIDDDEYGVRTISAEEVPIGVASPPVFSHQDASSFAANQFVAPGACTTPVLIAPPALITNNALEVWIATSGGSNWGGANVWTSTDGTNYQLTGTINGGCRYGVTTSAMGVVADPDTTTTLGVNLATSLGTLTSTSLSAVNAGATLCLVDSELFAYETATLTSANHYNLTYLRRGFGGTTVAAHSIGAPFVRLDGTEFAFTYQPMQAGATIYVKLQAFNLFGNAPEDISTVTAYSITLPTRTGATTWSSVVGIPANVAALTGSEAIQNSQVTVSGGTINGIGTGNGTAVANSSITISGGALGGIGSGSGTVVANSSITVASGVLTGVGTVGVTVDNGVLSTALTTGGVVPLTASGYTGQTLWGTFSALTPTQLVQKPSNMLYNPTGKLGLQGWTINTGAWGGSFFAAGIGDGPYFITTSGSNAAPQGLYETVVVQAGQGYSLQGQIYTGGLSGTAAVGRLYIEWLTSASAHISYSSLATVPSGNTWTTVQLVSQTAPTGAAFARIWMDIAGTTWTNTSTAWRYLKLELNTVCTPFSDDVTYGSAYQGGTLIDSLTPAQAGADVTSSHSSNGFAGQGALATLGSVDTAQINANAVSNAGTTNPTPSLSSATGTTTIATITVTTTGGPVLLLGSTTLFGVATQTPAGTVSVYRDGVSLQGMTYNCSVTNFQAFPFIYYEVPSAGSHTYRVDVNPSNATAVHYTSTSLTTLELKR